eukprot:scpid89427/ scgid30691/ 
MSALLRQGSLPEGAKELRNSSFLVEEGDSLGTLENSSRFGKSRGRLTKRARTTSWSTLALSLTNKNSSNSSNTSNHTISPSQSIPSIPSKGAEQINSHASPGSFTNVSPGSPKTQLNSRKSSMSLFIDPLPPKDFGMSMSGSSSMHNTGSPSSFESKGNLSLDTLFNGKCYDPEPVDICDQYHDPDWKPVPINEETVEIADKSDSALFNTSHEHQPFYHRELSRESACRMFERFGGDPGLCVVRDSTRTPGHYTLTVWNGRTVVNYRIEFSVRNSQGQYLLSGTTPFRSIGEVLLFLLHNSHFFPTAPTMYIPRIPDDAKERLYSELFVPPSSRSRTRTNSLS